MVKLCGARQVPVPGHSYSYLEAHTMSEVQTGVTSVSFLGSRHSLEAQTSLLPAAASYTRWLESGCPQKSGCEAW